MSGLAHLHAEGGERLRHLSARFHRFLVGRCRRLVPAPSVLEGLNLCRRPRAVLGLEDLVVIEVGVERGVEVDAVHGPLADVAAEDIEVIAVVEEVVGRHGQEPTPGPGAACRSRCRS